MALTNHHSEQEVNQMFTRLAKRYDLMNDVVSLGTQRRWRQKFFDQLAVFPGADSLDLCCGTADLTIKLAQVAGPRGRTIGVDFNEAMLAAGAEKVKAADLNKDIELVQGDAMQLPFAANQFIILLQPFQMPVYGSSSHQSGKFLQSVVSTGNG